jgi:hypothetical protein
MNFNKLTSEKKTRLITVCVAVLVIAGGLGFGLIRYQYQHVSSLVQERQAVESKLTLVQNAAKHSDQIEAQLQSSVKLLSDAEADIGSGDLYAWAINLVRTSKAGYKVEIPQVSPDGSPVDVDLIPAFPYKQARFILTGSAHYHDFGRFVANFENHFPHLRVINLSMEPNLNATPEESEMITFKMVIVALVKSNAA